MRASMLRWGLALLVLVAGSASAVDYYWQPVSSAGVPLFTPSNSFAGACQVWITNDKPAGTSLSSMDVAGGRCWFLYPNGNTGSEKVGRFGDSCPSGHTYNSAQGRCDSPPPNIGEQCGTDANGAPKYTDSQGNCVVGDDLDQAAVCKALANTGTRTKKVFVRFDGDGTPHAPTIADKTGCVAELALSGVDHCKLPAAKSEGGITLVPNGSYCTVFVNYTGEVDNDTGEGYPVGNPEAGEEGVCPNPDQCLAPEPPIVKDSKPCNYMSDGQIVGCESQEFEGNPG
ncbi:hypothetical protein ACFW0B_25820, partial [Pseudomonas sp. CR1201]